MQWNFPCFSKGDRRSPTTNTTTTSSYLLTASIQIAMLTATGSSQIYFFSFWRSTNTLMRQKASNQINQYDDQTDHRSTAWLDNQLGSLSIDALKQCPSYKSNLRLFSKTIHSINKMLRRSIHIFSSMLNGSWSQQQFIGSEGSKILAQAFSSIARSASQIYHRAVSWIIIHITKKQEVLLESIWILWIRRIQDLMEINWSHQFRIESTIFSIGVTTMVTISTSICGSEGSQSFQWHRSKKCFMCCYYFNRDDQHLQISSQVLRLLESVSTKRSQHRASWMDRWILCCS